MIQSKKRHRILKWNLMLFLPSFFGPAKRYPKMHHKVRQDQSLRVHELPWNSFVQFHLSICTYQLHQFTLNRYTNSCYLTVLFLPLVQTGFHSDSCSCFKLLALFWLCPNGHFFDHFLLHAISWPSSLVSSIITLIPNKVIPTPLILFPSTLLTINISLPNVFFDGRHRFLKNLHLSTISIHLSSSLGPQSFTSSAAFLALRLIIKLTRLAAVFRAVRRVHF